MIKPFKGPLPIFASLRVPLRLPPGPIFVPFGDFPASGRAPASKAAAASPREAKSMKAKPGVGAAALKGSLKGLP